MSTSELAFKLLQQSISHWYYFYLFIYFYGTLYSFSSCF